MNKNMTEEQAVQTLLKVREQLSAGFKLSDDLWSNRGIRDAVEKGLQRHICRVEAVKAEAQSCAAVLAVQKEELAKLWQDEQGLVRLHEAEWSERTARIQRLEAALSEQSQQRAGLATQLAGLRTAKAQRLAEAIANDLEVDKSAGDDKAMRELANAIEQLEFSTGSIQARLDQERAELEAAEQSHDVKLQALQQQRDQAVRASFQIQWDLKVQELAELAALPEHFGLLRDGLQIPVFDRSRVMGFYLTNDRQDKARATLTNEQLHQLVKANASPPAVDAVNEIAGMVDVDWLLQWMPPAPKPAQYL